MVQSYTLEVNLVTRKDTIQYLFSENVILLKQKALEQKLNGAYYTSGEKTWGKPNECIIQSLLLNISSSDKY